MKITCQACQAKYTIADEKIQGKIAKIRCRKCGATVLVDASTGGAAKAEGAPAPAATDSWLVSVAEGDQRTMTQRDVVDAYGAHVITSDTYVWKEGMTDWQPLAEVAELMTAINAAAPVAISPSAPPEPEPAPAPSAAPAPIAARRDPARAGADLFAGGPIDDEVATSAPPHVLPRGGVGSAASASSGMANASQGAGGLTGARDEHSVLFSLSALTGGSKAAPSAPVSSPVAPAPAPARNEDSGLIDLNALAQAQRTRAPQAVESAPTPAAFVFPAALGTVEVPRESRPRSKMPMFIGGGIALAGIVAAAIIVAGGKKEEAPTTPAMGAVSASASAEPSVPAAAAMPTPAASGSADTTASSDSASAKPIRRTPTTSRPAARPGPVAPAVPPPPVAPALPPPKKSPCGCATGDLQCQIRCSAMGH